LSSPCISLACIFCEAGHDGTDQDCADSRQFQSFFDGNLYLVVTVIDGLSQFAIANDFDQNGSADEDENSDEQYHYAAVSGSP